MMLGIFLILCLAVYFFIKLQIHNLLREDSIQPVEIDRGGRTYNVCHRAAMLRAISILVVLLGYLGCAWPYLFIKGIDRGTYFWWIAMGLLPVVAMAFGCYSWIRYAHGYVKISVDEIEYKRRKSSSVKVSDIKKITYYNVRTYQIHLKEKGTKRLLVDLNGFYKQKELCAVMEQLPDDPDTKGKIIYRNDGQGAILYGVGPNGKDDGGYKDEGKGSKQKRDDIIYWQRSLKE